MFVAQIEALQLQKQQGKDMLCNSILQPLFEKSRLKSN